MSLPDAPNPAGPSPAFERRYRPDSSRSPTPSARIDLLPRPMRQAVRRPPSPSGRCSDPDSNREPGIRESSGMSSARESTRPTSAIRGERGPDARPHAVIEVTKEPREAVKRCRPVRASLAQTHRQGWWPRNKRADFTNQRRSLCPIEFGLGEIDRRDFRNYGHLNSCRPVPLPGARGVAVPRAVCSTRGTLSSSATGSEPGPVLPTDS